MCAGIAQGVAHRWHVPAHGYGALGSSSPALDGSDSGGGVGSGSGGGGCVVVVAGTVVVVVGGIVVVVGSTVVVVTCLGFAFGAALTVVLSWSVFFDQGFGFDVRSPKQSCHDNRADGDG